MSADEQSRFLQQLAEDLNSRDIKLPSFPDVVINIRTALEDPTCTAERLGDVIRTDPVLVARLLMSANSAYHNRAGIEIVDLNLAVSRLGFEVVRNTAITLAVEQIFNASEHEDLRADLKDIWTNSMSLASMSFVIGRQVNTVNADDAFLGGLLHEIGKLYILTKVRDFPGLMGEPEALAAVLRQWMPTVGRSIVESWGFSSEIAASLDIEENLHPDDNAPATLVDVVYAAKSVLEADDGESTGPDDQTAGKLGISEATIPALKEAYDMHAQSMRT